MTPRFVTRAIVCLSLTALAACAQLTDGPGDDSGGLNAANTRSPHPQDLETSNRVWDLFNRGSPENTVLVNRYLWAASLEVLEFLPVETIDPFTGVIVTGFGAPPGGNRDYRATILIDDAALEARSLNLALSTRAGPASAATIRAVEDAIMTRARQLRVADSRL